jgi:hypothetical protein
MNVSGALKPNSIDRDVFGKIDYATISRLPNSRLAPTHALDF